MVRNGNQAEGVQNADKPQGSQQKPEQQRPEKQRPEQQKPEQQKPEQQKSEQQKPEYQGRNRNNNQGVGQGQIHGGIQGNPQVQRVQSQPRHQSSGPSNTAQGPGHREGHILNQSQNQNKSDPGSQVVSQAQHTQTQPRNIPQNQRSQPERHDGFQKEGGQNKGFYRNRDTERENQPRQRTVQAAGSRYGGLRSKAEETIDDIKEDIVRLEKEIELEMKEIRSLKL